MSKENVPMSREVSVSQDPKRGIFRIETVDGTIFKINVEGRWITVDQQVAGRARKGTTFYELTGDEKIGWKWQLADSYNKFETETEPVEVMVYLQNILSFSELAEEEKAEEMTEVAAV